MDFLWSLFEPVVFFVQDVIKFFYHLTGLIGFENYGLAIILLTIVVKALLYPLTVKQVKSMKAMQDLQPKMKKLQEKYKGNPQLMQQELGKLYQEAGVNPMAGCLPLLVQMPILMAMFYALRDTSYQGDPSFLWLPTLSEPDPYYILPVLSALTTFLTQKQTTSEMNQQMKIMMFVMPLFIGWMSMNFASGLVVYWVTMNIVQIFQQWWMYRGEEKPQSKSKKKAKKEAV